MSNARLCPHCRAPLRWLETDCPSCGKPTGQRLPWYVYGMGAVIVLLLFLLLSDFAGLAEFVGNLLDQVRR